MGQTVYMIKSQDGGSVTIEDLVKQWNPDKAQHSGHILKLFFIDACHGRNAMGFVSRGTEAKDLGVEIQKLPEKGNFHFGLLKYVWVLVLLGDRGRRSLDVNPS